MGLKERLLSFIELKNLSVQRFEQEVGLSNASVSKMGDNTRRSTIDRISNKFPEINANWLLTGEGEMLNPIGESFDGKTNKSNAINNRIRQIISDYFNDSIVEFCSKLNLFQATVRITLERNIPASHEILMAIINDSSLNISPEWLMTGKGNMLNTQLDTPMYNEVTPLNQNYIINVPLVNQYAQAGYVCGYQDATYITTLPTMPFIVDHEAKGNYVAFEVRGDSMNDGTEDSYLEGDRLLCREIYSQYWVESKLHIKKWDFVIVHEDGIIVKRIIDHDVENHTITIHSLNDMYPDRVIDLADVKQIFNVIELQRPRRR